MKSDEVWFHGSVAFLAPEKKKRASAIRRRLERNPFLEEPPALLGSSPYEQRRKQWRDQVKIFLEACYKETKSVLGEEEARQLFAETPPPAPKLKRGHQAGGTRSRGRLLPNLSAVLLREYDEYLVRHTEDDRRKAPRETAEQLYADGKGAQYGQSALAIEKHLRRLLIERDRRREEAAGRHREAAEQHQRLIDAYKRQTGQDFPQGLLTTQGLVADNE